MKFRIGLIAFIVLVAVIGVAAFLFFPKGGARNGIYFKTYEGVYAKITGSVTGGANDIELNDLVYGDGSAPTGQELSSWQVNLDFGDNDEITITIKVNNYGNEPLYVFFKDNGKEISNVTKTIYNNGVEYESGKLILLQASSDETIFTVVFKREQDVATTIRYSYEVKLQSALTDEDITSGSLEIAENSDFTYTYDTAKGEAKITGLTSNNTKTELSLPSMVANEGGAYVVTSVEAKAFKGNKNITSVVIPNTVKELKTSAFQDCTNLTQVTIPDSVTKLGNKVFKGCTGLTEIALPNTLKTLGSNVFSGCSFTELNLTDSITTLNIDTFAGIKNIGKLTIPCSVTALPNASGGLFTDVDRIENMVIEATSKGTEVGNASEEYNNFGASSNIINLQIQAGVTKINNSAFGNCGSLSVVTFESNSQLTSIGNYAFYACRSLYNFVIPENVTDIGKFAFYCCGLNSITIQNNLSNIEEGAFEGCHALVEIYNLSTINIEAGSEEYGKIAYYAKDIYHNASATSKVTVVNGVAYYKESENDYIAISLRDKTVTDVILDQKTKEIGYRAFGDEALITSVTIPDSVTEIGTLAFYGCREITNIIIPNSVKIIGEDAFSFCSGLTNIIIPGSVISIGSSAFRGTNLTSIYIPSTVVNISAGSYGDGLFIVSYTGVKVYTDAETKPSGWGTYWNSINSSSRATVVWNKSLEEYQAIISG